ncbi:permease for cytosine/purines, uracil, thiamine, allantoin-domain-containing protein [Aspergillus multicolor]|uniref:purine-cytosine permease family protein n=1 Tax=Aspergillus multicolor TaxID=41759 RepID=UPI003CCD7088
MDIHQPANDIEKGTEAPSPIESCSTQTGTGTVEIIKPYPVFLQHLHKFEQRLGRIGGGIFETQGANHIPEEERQPPSIWSALVIWMSFIMNLGMLPMGFLGPSLGLTFKDTLSACLAGIIFGAALPAYTATFGPRLGLRQMAVARFSFGFHPTRLIIVIMILSSMAFMLINMVIVGQALSVVSDSTLDLSVGIVIIAVLSYIPTFFGFRVIMVLEKYTWVLALVLFITLYAQAIPSIQFSTPSSVTGLKWSGAWLSFFTIQFSNGAGWTAMASDYTCNYPSTTSRLKVALLTWTGIAVPTAFVNILGIILAQAVFFNADHPYASAYSSHGLGGVLHAAWHPTAWAKAALVLCMFTVLGNVVGMAYSTGIACQLLGRYSQLIPRFIWSLLTTIIAMVLALVGRNSLLSIVQNFVALLGYWIVPFAVILFLEDVALRRKDEGYDVATWNDPGKLPYGVAAVATLLIAYFAGGFVGMAQTWFVGPVAEAFAEAGGDVGVFLAFGWSAVVYLPLRFLERRASGR